MLICLAVLCAFSQRHFIALSPSHPWPCSRSRQNRARFLLSLCHPSWWPCKSEGNQEVYQAIPWRLIGADMNSWNSMLPWSANTAYHCTGAVNNLPPRQVYQSNWGKLPNPRTDALVDKGLSASAPQSSHNWVMPWAKDQPPPWKPHFIRSTKIVNTFMTVLIHSLHFMMTWFLLVTLICILSMSTVGRPSWEPQTNGK